MNPTILVIFGATGDLMAKKITPALYSLFKNNKLPSKFKIIAFARRDFNGDKFNELLKENLNKYLKITDIDENFYSLFAYHQGQLDDSNAYTSLKRKIEEESANLGENTQILFHFSVAPEFYTVMIENLGKLNFNPSTKLIIEKPFGDDVNSAMELDKYVKSYFKEDQIYIIDHYLGKNLLQNILTFRFENPIFQPIWNNKFIKKVEIKRWEMQGLENRGAFYETVGALKDVGQNHMLEVVALLTMENSANQRQARASAINKLKIFNSEEEFKTNTYRAQHSGYRQIEDVSPESNIETFFSVKVFVNSPEWEGIPFTIEAGKKLEKDWKEVVVYFEKNKIVFTIIPEESVKIEFISKKENEELVSEQMIYSLKKKDLQYIEEYANLFVEAFEGKQNNFVSVDEVVAAWKLIDPIIRAWKNNVVPLNTYDPGTMPNF